MADYLLSHADMYVVRTGCFAFTDLQVKRFASIAALELKNAVLTPIEFSFLLPFATKSANLRHVPTINDLCHRVPVPTALEHSITTSEMLQASLLFVVKTELFMISRFTVRKGWRTGTVLQVSSVGRKMRAPLLPLLKSCRK